MLRQLRAIFEQLGDKMSPKSAKMSQDRAGGMSKGRHMRQDSDGRGSAEWGGDPTPFYGYPRGRDLGRGKVISRERFLERSLERPVRKR